MTNQRDAAEAVEVTREDIALARKLTAQFQDDDFDCERISYELAQYRLASLPAAIEPASGPCKLPANSDLAVADRLARRMGGRFVPHGPAVSEGEPVACKYCNGFGYVMVARPTVSAEPERVRCGNCSSSGVLIASLPAASEGEPVAWRTMTINLTEQEQEALSRLMAEQELSDVQVFRQALRGYQLDHERRKNGETVSWSGDAQRARDFAGTSAPAPSDQEKLVGELVEAIGRRRAIYSTKAEKADPFAPDDCNKHDRMTHAAEAFDRLLAEIEPIISRARPNGDTTP